jgi:hypothetical protein
VPSQKYGPINRSPQKAVDVIRSLPFCTWLASIQFGLSLSQWREFCLFSLPPRWTIASSLNVIQRCMVHWLKSLRRLVPSLFSSRVSSALWRCKWWFRRTCWMISCRCLSARTALGCSGADPIAFLLLPCRLNFRPVMDTSRFYEHINYSTKGCLINGRPLWVVFIKFSSNISI